MTCYDCHGPSPCRNRACPSCVAEPVPAPAPAFAPMWGMPVPDDDERERVALRDAVARLTSRLDLLEQHILELAAEVRRR